MSRARSPVRRSARPPREGARRARSRSGPPPAADDHIAPKLADAAAAAAAAAAGRPGRPAFSDPGAAAFFQGVVFRRAPSPDDDRGAHTTFEIFAGAAGVSAALADLGCETFPVDWAGNRHAAKLPVIPIDLASEPGQAELFRMLETHAPRFVWLAPPCGTFSRARDKPIPKRALDAGTKQPAPLRTDAAFLGIPGLPADAAARVDTANRLAAVAARVAEWCLQRGAGFAIENPHSSRLWLLPRLDRLLHTAGVSKVSFHHCRYGGQRAKHTKLVTNVAALARLEAHCRGDHPHKPWAAFDATGYWRFYSAEEAEYPEPLAQAIAAAAVAHLRGETFADVPPGALFGKLRGVLGARPRRGRGLGPDMVAAAGRQPRGRHPPLIPERPGASAAAGPGPRNEGEGAHGAGTEDTELEDWSPQGFLDEALLLTHPFDVKANPPDDIKVFINGWLEGNVQNKIAEAFNELARWRARALQLEADEAELHAALPAHLQPVLKGKRLLLLREMAQAIGHCDATVVAELAGGFPIAGRIRHSGVFPRRAPDEEIRGASLEWLHDRAPAIQAALVDTLRRRPLDPAIAAEVAAATATEVDKGWVQGPFDPAALDARFGAGAWVPARRFGVRQGAKTRPIDDLARSLVNAATTVEDVVRPAGVDVVVTVARAWAEALRERGLDSGPGAGEWAEMGGKTLDLEAAYRQCGVREDHLKYAVFGYEAAPKPDEKFLYVAAALPFGAGASVIQFNRVARLLLLVGLRLFGVPWTHFFDDFPVVGPRVLWEPFGRLAGELGDLLGWRWKAPTLDAAFAQGFTLLGVRMDLEHARRGEIVVANTTKRIDELGGAIRELIAAGSVLPHAAASLAGRLMFAAAQCFGRSGVAFLSPIRAAARRQTPSQVRGRLGTALRWWLVFLRSAAPRVLQLGDPTEPILLFVDGCCEDDGRGLHGVGAVVVDRATGTCEAFGLDLWQPAIAALRTATGNEQLIGQLEIVPALLAFWRWPLLFAAPGRRVLIFVDNDSARHALIKGFSPVDASRALVEAFWVEAAKLQAAPWFERVPTLGNPADAPSRLRFDLLAELRPQPRVVDAPAGSARLQRVIQGPLPGARGAGGDEP